MNVRLAAVAVSPRATLMVSSKTQSDAHMNDRPPRSPYRTADELAYVTKAASSN